MVDYAVVLMLQLNVAENRKDHEGAIDLKAATVLLTEWPLARATLGGQVTDAGRQTDKDSNKFR